MALIGWATHVLQWYLQKVTMMQIGVNLIKITLVRIVGCNSPYMKAESLVIVDQHATVNVLRPCTHRPSRQGSNIDSKNLFFIFSLLLSLKLVFILIAYIEYEKGMTDSVITVMKS